MKMERWMQERASAAIEGCKSADDVPEYVMDFYHRISVVYQHIHNNKEMGQHISGPVIGIAIENMKLNDRITALESKIDQLAPDADKKAKQKQSPARVGLPRPISNMPKQPVGV